MKKQFYVAFALITGGAVTYYIYWDSTKKEKEKEGKVDIGIGLEREQATKNPKKLFFNKNKKKMAPYDIKPTPNPKIQPNLHFFLKDPKNEKEAEVNIKIQTD